MASIGPQFPDDTRKRKRKEDETEPKNSRARQETTQITTKQNDDEIALDYESDSELGPSPSIGPSMPVQTIGPAMPPSETKSIGPPTAPPKKEKRLVGPTMPSIERPSMSFSTASIGPTMPPPFEPTPKKETKSRGPTMPPQKETKSIGPIMPSASIGPTMPSTASIGPSIGPTMPSEPPRPTPSVSGIGPAMPPPQPDDSDSGSDSDYGPALPSATSISRPAPMPITEDEPKQPQRDSWMLAPPTSSTCRAPDPTKLRARKFATGRAASASTGTNEVDSLWTETVQQKRKRLEDAVLGRTSTTTQTQSGPTLPSSKQNSAVDAARIEDYVSRTRGRSLYQEHQTRRHESGSKDDEDDPSKRAFDKDKDMALGGRIGTAKRHDLVNRAGDFDSRFSKGSFL